MITTPNVQYVTVDTYAELPATGSADTIYRVANYDGTQVASDKYAEYAWSGTQYKLLDVKEYGIDEEPIVGSRNPVQSGGVASELVAQESALVDQITHKFLSNGSVNDHFNMVVISTIYNVEPVPGTTKGRIITGTSGNNRFYYSSDIIPKGTIVNYQCVANVSRAQVFGCTTQNLAELDNLVGVEFDNS